MPWWVWLLVGWATVATIAALWLTAAAALARSRERVARTHQYSGEIQRERQAAASGDRERSAPRGHR